MIAEHAFPDPIRALPPVVADPEQVALQLQLDRELHKLEAMRSREMDLRHALVASLNLLSFFTSQAEFRIQTRQYADGVTGLSPHIQAASEAESALIDCIAEIEQQHRCVEELRDDLASMEVA